MFLDGLWRDASEVAAWVARFTAWTPGSRLPVVLVAGEAGGPGPGGGPDESSSFAQQVAALLDTQVIATRGQVVELPTGEILSGRFTADSIDRVTFEMDDDLRWELYGPVGIRASLGPDLVRVLEYVGFDFEPPRSSPDVPLVWAGVRTAQDIATPAVLPSPTSSEWAVARELVERWNHYPLRMEEPADSRQAEVEHDAAVRDVVLELVGPGGYDAAVGLAKALGMSRGVVQPWEGLPGGASIALTILRQVEADVDVDDGLGGQNGTQPVASGSTGPGTAADTAGAPASPSTPPMPLAGRPDAADLAPPAAPELIGEATVEGLDRVRAIGADRLRERIDRGLPDVDARLRDSIARHIGELLTAATPHAAHEAAHEAGHHGAAHEAEHGDVGHAEHDAEHQLEEWSEALTQGLWFGDSDTLVHVAFAPTKAPTAETLTPARPEENVVEGTSTYTTATYTDTETQQKNIGVGLLFDYVVSLAGKVSFLAPGISFVPRKQLIVESGRTAESIAGSRLMDGPQGTYTSGTTATISVLRGGRPAVSAPVDLPEHEVTYRVRAAAVSPAAAPAEPAWESDVAAPSRLAKFPFGLTKIDAEPLLRGIGGALLEAGYTGQEAAAALKEIAEEVFNPQLAGRSNQPLFDGTHRSGLLDVGHVLGNMRIALELTAVRREGDIDEAGDSGQPTAVRVDIGDTMKTDDTRTHGYDAPFEAELLVNFAGFNVAGGGFGFETSTMYSSSAAEQHARRFDVSFNGPAARYAARMRAVVSFDTDSRTYLTPALNPLARRRPVAGFSVEGVVGEIVVPAAQAQAFQDAVAAPEPDHTTTADRLVAAYTAHAVRAAPPGVRPPDGTSLFSGAPLVEGSTVSGALEGDAESGRYVRGALPTILPPVPIDQLRGGEQLPRAVAGLRRSLRALLRHAAAGGVQVVVHDPWLAASVAKTVDEVWAASADGPSEAVLAALAARAEADESLHGLETAQILLLFVTDPNVRIVDANGVLLSRHNPRIPVARQYEVAPDGRILRSVRTTLGDEYADDIRTPLRSLDAGGATVQLATGSGMGPAAAPMAPGLAKVLRHIERAMTVLMDGRNETDEMWDLNPALRNLRRYQDARVRTELMSKLGAYFGSARLRSRFGALLGAGLKITVTIKSRLPWQAPRRFEIEVRADLLERLDGGVAAVDLDVMMDLQSQGDMEAANIVEQESAVMLVGDAEIELEIVPAVGINISEIYLELEYGKVNVRELTTTDAVFNRLSAPSGRADRPEYLVDYQISITEFDRNGAKAGPWTHSVRDEISPVVPRSFQPPAGPHGPARLAAYADGLDDFWQLSPATAEGLSAQQLRFDQVGASGVSAHFANLDKLLAEALELVREHDERHGIDRDAVEQSEIEIRLREVFDEAYFAAHFARLTGANGMPVALPWLRRMLPRPSGFHGGQLSNIKSSLDVKVVMVPAARPTAGAGDGGTVTDATTMSRQHKIVDAQGNAGSYGSVFLSVIAGPRVKLGEAGDSPDTTNWIAPQLEGRAEYVKYSEGHTATAADDFTILEQLADGTAIEPMSAVVQLTVNTRFSKQDPVSTTRSYFLGDGTAQLELPAPLEQRLTLPEPLADWEPAVQSTPGIRRPITPQLAYDTAHVHALVPGAEVAERGGIVGWVAHYLDEQRLLDRRFMSSADVNHRKLVVAYDEVALAGQLSLLTTVGVPVHLDNPDLGDRRLTVVLKATSARGPRYVRSSGGARVTTGGKAQDEQAKLSETEYAAGLGPNVGFNAVVNPRGGAVADPGVAYRRDIGRVLGAEEITVAEELRRVSGPAPDAARNPTTDDFLDEFQLELEVYTDWVPAEPVRFLTAAAKPLTAPLARWGMAATPARPRTDIGRSSLSLDDTDGFRTPIATTLVPGAVRAPMTMDRTLTEPVTNPARTPRPAPVPGYRAPVEGVRPSPLNRALAPVIYGIGLGNVANVQRHVRYTAGSWNSPDALWRSLVVRGRDEHVPAKEGSYAPTGNKGRTVALALHPRVLRNHLPKVLGHSYPVVPKGKEPGVEYGFQASGLARPLPRETAANANPMMGMSFGARESANETSFARSSAMQLWADPVFGGETADGQPAIPHISNLVTVEPSAGQEVHAEENRRIYDTFVAYEFTGLDILRSRGVDFVLNAPGSLTGYLRHRDAAALATDFPEQFVHPDAVTVDSRTTLDELAATLDVARPATIHLFVDAYADPDIAGDLAEATRTFARDAARDGHTIHLAIARTGQDAADLRLDREEFHPAAPVRPGTDADRDAERDADPGRHQDPEPVPVPVLDPVPDPDTMDGDGESTVRHDPGSELARKGKQKQPEIAPAVWTVAAKIVRTWNRYRPASGDEHAVTAHNAEHRAAITEVANELVARGPQAATDLARALGRDRGAPQPYDQPARGADPADGPAEPNSGVGQSTRAPALPPANFDAYETVASEPVPPLLPVGLWQGGDEDGVSPLSPLDPLGVPDTADAAGVRQELAAAWRTAQGPDEPEAVRLGDVSRRPSVVSPPYDQVEGALSDRALRDEHGIPREHLDRLQQLATSLGLRIVLRPTNPDSAWHLERGALPKPTEIKAKTIGPLDVWLGADAAATGLAGLFRPVLPERGAEIEARPGLWDRILQRFAMREREFEELSPVLAELTAQDRFRVDHGVVHGRDSAGGWRSIAGDHDVFDLLSLDGRRLSAEQREAALRRMIDAGAGIMHDAHVYWIPTTESERRIYDTILDAHEVDGEPLIEIVPRHSVGAIGSFARGGGGPVYEAAQDETEDAEAAGSSVHLIGTGPALVSAAASRARRAAPERTAEPGSDELFEGMRQFRLDQPDQPAGDLQAAFDRTAQEQYGPLDRGGAPDAAADGPPIPPETRLSIEPTLEDRSFALPGLIDHAELASIARGLAAGHDPRAVDEAHRRSQSLGARLADGIRGELDPRPPQRFRLTLTLLEGAEAAEEGMLAAELAVLRAAVNVLRQRLFVTITVGMPPLELCPTAGSR